MLSAGFEPAKALPMTLEITPFDRSGKIARKFYRMPIVGIEPTTTRLKGARSTDWAKSALTGFIGVHTRSTDWATNDIAIGQDSNLRPRLYSRKKKKLLYETILCFTATCQTLRDGIEPPTSRLTVERSNQLSYQSYISVLRTFH